MKVLSLVCLAFASMLVMAGRPLRKESTYSYYCLSRGMTAEQAARHQKMDKTFGTTNFQKPPAERIIRAGIEKQVINITRVRDTAIGEAAIKNITKTWGEWINSNCVNEHGCTSDLRYYEDRDLAQKRWKETMALYSDTNKYLVRIVEP